MDQDTIRRSADGKACLEAALEYLKMGWSAIPLCPPDHVGIGRVSKEHTKKCKNPGKVPWIQWEQYYDELPKESDVRYWWRQLPNSNVGVALGPVSKMVRIDCEGVKGLARLQEMSKGDLPPTLEFKSGRSDGSGRGWLYGVPDGAAIRTTFGNYGTNQELRFQAKGAQTVLPPSRHKEGGQHLWVPGHGPGEVEIALMPEWLLAEMAVTSNGKSKRSGRWSEIQAGVSEGSRNCSATVWIGKILGALRDIQDNGDVGMAWVATQAWNERNDPPIPEDELRDVFDSILRKETDNRNEKDQNAFETYYEDQVAKSAAAAAALAAQPTSPVPPESNGHCVEVVKPPLPDWHLIILESEKPEYKLRSPMWSDKEKVKNKDGYVLLSLDELMTWQRLRKAVLAQAEFLPRQKMRNWTNLVNQLLDAGEKRKVVLEAKRPLVIAELLWNVFRRARDIALDDNGDPVYGTGSPKRLDDNRVIVKSDWLSSQSSFAIEKIGRKEITEIMSTYGMKSAQFGSENKRSRWWIIEHDELMRMKDDVLSSK